MIHDTHCHLDLYHDPYKVALATEAAQIATVAVTNLPSAYFAAKPHMSRFSSLKLAVGLHPLLASDHSAQERQLFKVALQETFFVGEIGLDFSRHGIETKEKQLESFQFVLKYLHGIKRFITLHSRGAENSVLNLLTQYQIETVIFHWYSGSVRTVDAILTAGHYFSINTSMIKSANGQKLIMHIPKERILTETDGPFIKVANKPAVPADVRYVHDYLSKAWKCDLMSVQDQLNKNLGRLFGLLGQNDPLNLMS